jgi:hypothetical protein
LPPTRRYRKVRRIRPHYRTTVRPRPPSPQDFASEEDPGKLSPLNFLLKDGKQEMPGDTEKRRVRRSSEVQNCWTRGSFVSGSSNGRVHMCSECQIVRQLPANVIPQYINEAACRHILEVAPGKVKEDNLCVVNTGQCVQKILRFPALIRRGYVKDDALSRKMGKEIYVEDWAVSTQDIRASCQCQMYSYIAKALAG